MIRAVYRAVPRASAKDPGTAKPPDDRWSRAAGGGAARVTAGAVARTRARSGMPPPAGRVRVMPSSSGHHYGHTLVHAVPNAEAGASGMVTDDGLAGPDLSCQMPASRPGVWVSVADRCGVSAVVTFTRIR
ncbi:hypothetical protein EHYA_02499 [Embleya hyalina]|uniref:Uncharacterized protein n=1 Tax=Embleya hyalina TaxID=516124 RepID=A0A401YJP6_9ACTN|nr:hypothetical protein EHYA_02499 [Embleya hyalina]